MVLSCKQKHLSSLIAAAMYVCKHWAAYTHTNTLANMHAQTHVIQIIFAG